MKLINILFIIFIFIGLGSAYTSGPIEMRTGANITLSGGYIHLVTNGTAAQDAVTYSQLQTMIAKSIVSAKGVLISGSGAATPVAVPVGTDGQHLTSNSSATAGVSWSTSPTITNSVAWTPTGSWSTNTAYTGRWYRVGDRGFYEVMVTLSGAPNSASLTINLPSGHTVDTAKVLGTTSQFVLGYGSIEDTGVIAYKASVQYASTTAVGIYIESVSGTYISVQNAVTQAVPQTFASGDKIRVKFDLPISGWT